MRKNRTLRAGFLGTTTVLEMLEMNWRTWCAQNDIPVEDGPSDPNTTSGMDVDVDVDAGVELDTLPDDDPQDEEEWSGIMDVDDPPAFLTDPSSIDPAQKPRANSKKRRKGKVAELVREKVRRVLEDETELADRRARMCDEGDFLKLLWAFNKEGIHFS